MGAAFPLFFEKENAMNQYVPCHEALAAQLSAACHATVQIKAPLSLVPQVASEARPFAARPAFELPNGRSQA